MVYPTLIAALSAGLIADLYGLASAIIAVALLTFASGAVTAVMMEERKTL